MRCPSCGKNTPDHGAFCLNCGASLAAPVRHHVDWEYKDFVYDFPPKGMWARLGSGAYSEAAAKLEFWQNYQNAIYAELQQWEDDGWEPVGAVDSGCIEIRTVSDFRNISALGWVLIAIVSLASWGLLFILFLIFGRSTFAEPVRCVIPMRRDKNYLASSPLSRSARPSAKALPNALPSAAFPNVNVKQQMRMCPLCAHMNRMNAKFCARCGQTL